MQYIYNMQKSKRNAIRKSRKSHKKRRFTKRRVVKGGGDNHQNIQKDNEFKKTIDLYQQEQRQEAIRREIMLRRAQAQAEAEERQRAEAEERQRAEDIRQSDLRRQHIAEERQREEQRLKEEQRQGNQGSALDALFALL
jgi:hypothetical protein